MSENKICKKKLCDAGSASCLFAFIALLAAAAGSALEFIGREIYNGEFGHTDKLFADNWESFIAIYEKSLIMLVMSLIVFMVCFVNKRKKKIGAEFGAAVTLLSAAMSVYPALYVYHAVTDDDFFRTVFEHINEREADFAFAMRLLIMALPLVSGVFLFICGISLWGRNATDDFSVRCPIMKRQPLEDVSEELNTERVQQPVQTTPSFEFTNSNYIAPESEQVQNADEPKPEAVSENAVIPETARCAACGALLKPGAKFCQSCGFAVEK